MPAQRRLVIYVRQAPCLRMRERTVSVRTLTALPDIHDVDVTAPVFRTALADTCRFLRSAGLADLFLVAAAHQHFRVEEDEALREVADRASGNFATSVVPFDSVVPGQEVAWRFNEDGAAVATVWSVDPKGTDVLSDSFRIALAKVGAFLAAARLTNILTVKLPSTGVLGNHVLHEFTNIVARAQITVVMPALTGDERRVGTWRADLDGSPVPVEYCWGC
jgi:hypothetical protein